MSSKVNTFGKEEEDGASPKLPSAEEQKQAYSKLDSQCSMKEGEQWYLVHFRWWQLWKCYTNVCSEISFFFLLHQLPFLSSTNNKINSFSLSCSIRNQETASIPMPPVTEGMSLQMRLITLFCSLIKGLLEGLDSLELFYSFQI